jgi:hypothetical protein
VSAKVEGQRLSRRLPKALFGIFGDCAALQVGSCIATANEITLQRAVFEEDLAWTRFASYQQNAHAILVFEPRLNARAKYVAHSMLYRPRQEITALVVLHLGVVVFWVGSLLPLLWVAQRPDSGKTVALLHDRSPTGRPTCAR